MRCAPYAFSVLNTTALCFTNGLRTELRHKPNSCSQLIPQFYRRHLSNYSLQDGPFRQYTETRLIGFSVEQMYDIASNIQHYHKFVPWCKKSQLHRRISETEADWLLEVGFPPVLERYDELTSKFRVISAPSFLPPPPPSA